jgi:hypothetical protein
MKTKLFFIVLFTTMMISCEKDPPTASEDHEWFNGFAIEETDSPDFQLLAAHEEEGFFAIDLGSNDSTVDRVIYFNEIEDLEIGIWFNENGMPVKAVSDKYIFLYENYTESTVDIALLTPENELIIEENFKIETIAKGYTDLLQEEFNSTNQQVKINQGFSVSRAIKFAGLGVGLVSCGAAIKASVGLALAVIAKPCGGLAISAASTFGPKDDVPLQGTTGFTSAALATTSCIMRDDNCIQYTLTTVGAIAGLFESLIEDREENIASGTGYLRFGGIWDRKDHDVLWLIIEKDQILEPFYSIESQCYIIYQAQFIAVEGNIFTYKAQNGNTIDLRYQRLPGDLLEITRLSDGFTAILSPSNRGETSFTPECGESSKIANMKQKPFLQNN